MNKQRANNRKAWSAVLVVFTVGALSTVRADAVFPGQPLGDAELASLRGGFFLGNLEISIGLEQIVSFNGETLAVNRLTIPNLNQISNGQVVSHTVETLVANLDASADGQSLVSTMSDTGGWITVIQNNLNRTTIQNSRQLNIQMNNLGAALNRIPDSMREPVLQLLGR
ncbi:hypothetical protein [Marinobacter sediminum]|uniref:hypothetical protein n=1 Tax=Marinobacter sediminum TaxID=256323 RepID=UPI00193A9B0A|nr:hypothetical protein [Marinobacter sediminum]